MNSLVAILLNRVMLWLCGDSLLTRAQDWVALYEDKTMPGAEKRERVLHGLQEELTVLGQDLTTSLIHLAIEAAVQYVRRRTAA